MGLQCPLLGTPVLGSLGLQCPFAGTPSLGIKMRVRPRGFLPWVRLTRSWKLVRSRPHCTRKRVQHRRCQPVGSLVGHLGLQCPPLRTPVLGTLGLLCPPQEHQASGTRRESEPTVSLVMVSSLFGVYSQENCSNCARRDRGSALFLLDERRDSAVTGIASS